ncbi:MAG: hypothetical protein ABSA75_00570 [Candidatus Bathyarchaeia archaeon]|jgi:hypothetical protein
MSSKNNEITIDGIEVRAIDKTELNTFLNGKKDSKKIVLPLVVEKKCLDFSAELEDSYFKPGTEANADFSLIMSFPMFFLVVPDTPRNRSAISTLRHKYGLKLPNLTKFDEYMELAYQVKNEKETKDLLSKMFNDVFKFINEKFGLGNVQQIERLFLGEEQWQSLAKVVRNAENASTGGSLINSLIDSEGVIRPQKGSHVILFRAECFDRMSRQDLVYNYLLTVAHELLHISGIKDEIKVHSMEFEFSEKFLGIYHDEKYKTEMFRDLEKLAIKIDHKESDVKENSCTENEHATHATTKGGNQ